MTVEIVGGRKIVGVGGERRFLVEGEDAPEPTSAKPAKKAPHPADKVSAPAEPVPGKE